MNRRTALRAIVGAAITAAVASACGQKGPLFSPEEKLEELERKRDKQTKKKS
ncbi:MAG: putative small lipoprotein YifL [Gammaproteobacteria bacterium]